MIPESVERRARWVLDTLGARAVGFGDDVPYRAAAWEQVDQGVRPDGDDVAEAFFHLARLEERTSERDRFGRFRASASCLQPLDPPLERLRARLGVDPPRWRGARFAVALTHDIDTPWRWTRAGLRGSASRLKAYALAGRGGPAFREARALGAVPLHKLRGTDPNWCFERVIGREAERGARSTFFVMAGHSGAWMDGLAGEAYARLRPRLVDTVLAGGAEIGLHGSYNAAEDAELLRTEKESLERLAGPVSGQRYHFLRVDPLANLAPLERLGFRYDASVGFVDAPGFRAGIAHPFRPWDGERDRPLDLVEIPLAAMDVTFDDRYLGLPAAAAERRLLRLLDWAAERGGGFSVLWHTDRFDARTSGGWDRLYFRLIDAVKERGGVCLSAGELAEEAAAWLR